MTEKIKNSCLIGNIVITTLELIKQPIYVKFSNLKQPSNGILRGLFTPNPGQSNTDQYDMDSKDYGKNTFNSGLVQLDSKHNNGYVTLGHELYHAFESFLHFEEYQKEETTSVEKRTKAFEKIISNKSDNSEATNEVKQQTQDVMKELFQGLTSIPVR